MMVRIDPNAYIVVGKIVGVHGIRGEVKVDVLTDFPERFEPGSELLVEGDDLLWRIVSSRPHKKMLLIRFERIEDRSQAAALSGRYLLVSRESAGSLPEGEYYADELIGLTVLTDKGVDLGEITEVWWTAANEVYVVEGSFGEVLLPAIADVIQHIDLAKGELVVKLLPGLVPDFDG